MILADTGFFLALAFTSDQHHIRAKQVAASLREPLLTTLPVLTETVQMLQRFGGSRAAIHFTASFGHSGIGLFALESSHFERIARWMDKYAELPMDLADASLLLAAEAHNEGRILSTDQRDFQRYRFKNHKPFRNLLLS